MQLVNGYIASSGQPTCKGVAEDDYFVVDIRLRGAVLGVARIHDTGSEPHSAVRMWLKGKPRRDVVRKLAEPAKAGAILPAGCLPEGVGEGWGGMAVMDRPEEITVDNLNDAFVDWVTKVEDQLAGVVGWRAGNGRRYAVAPPGPGWSGSALWASRRPAGASTRQLPSPGRLLQDG